MSSQSSSALAVVIACSLAACGGGGSGNSPTPSPSNRAPTLTASSAAVSVAENSTGTLFSVSASDPDGDNVSLTLTGDDASFFTLGSGGAISFKTAPNYDRFADADSDNGYVVIVQASDGRGGTVRSNVIVTVTNEREGITVERIASGIDDPAGMTMLVSSTLAIAQNDGTVLLLNGITGELTPSLDLALPTGSMVLDIASDTPSGSVLPVLLVREPNAISILYDVLTPTPRRRELASGPPGDAGGKLVFEGDVSDVVLVSIGDPGGNRAQGSSGYGSVFRVDLFSGQAATVGKGVRKPGGWLMSGSERYFADQGGSRQHELNSVTASDSLRNYGWPFFEGTVQLQAGAPDDIFDPVSTFTYGNGPLSATGIVLGEYLRGTNANVEPRLYFSGNGGKIFSVAPTFAAESAENRTADFKPDAGTIDEIVKIVGDRSGRLYILDADGEVFRVESD